MSVDTKFLKRKAAEARLHALTMIYNASSGHPGGSLGCIDLMTELYYRELKIDPENPADPDRDRFVMSKGHCSPAVYSTLAMKGYFPMERLQEFRRVDAHMSGHVEMSIPGVDMSTGSLGQGVSAASGMAMAGKLGGKDYRVYAMLGDGELEEGQVWETMMAAHKYKLDNLCMIADINGLQIDGPTAEVMPMEPLDQKFEAFGIHAVICDGHDFDSIHKALEEARATKGRPTMILAHTIKGKGVSFMENAVGWHGKAPSQEEYEQAKAELEAQIRELEG